MIRIATRTILANARSILKALVHRPRRICAMCDNNVLTFLPYKGGNAHAPQVVSSAGIIGSDLDNFSCPRCWATDRERHLLLYMRQLGMIEELGDARVLHFAPERRLSEIIRSQKPAIYLRGDLYPNLPDITRLDMESIEAEDRSFDLVIANHVLEHVNDDLKALAELYRVLDRGGCAILQTPFAANNAVTKEDASRATDEASRPELYGQEDHVRLFGKDIFERFSSVGFVSEVAEHASILGNIDALVYGVNEQEPFMLFRKP